MGKWTTEAQIDRARVLRAAGLKLADIAADVLNDLVYRDARARQSERMRRIAETKARMVGRANPAAGPRAADVIEHARQHCAVALPLIRRIRGAL